MAGFEDVAFVDVKDIVPKIETSISAGMNIGLRGPTGTGKTLLVRWLAKKHGKKMRTFNMTVHTGVEELKGRYVVKPGNEGTTQLDWIDGQLVEAMRNGDWVVIEEANFMPEEISSVMYSVMDDRRELILDEHENEVIKAHPDFRLFLTMNWGYKGTTYPNDAIKNRIDAWFDIAYLPKDKEAALVAHRSGVNVSIGNAMVQFAEKFREKKERSVPDISTRILVRWGQLIHAGMNPLDAAEHTVVPLLYYEEADKQKVREVLQFLFKKPMMEKKFGFAVGDTVTFINRSGVRYYGIVDEFVDKASGLAVKGYWASSVEKARKCAEKKDSDAEAMIMAEKIELVKEVT